MGLRCCGVVKAVIGLGLTYLLYFIPSMLKARVLNVNGRWIWQRHWMFWPDFH